MNLRNPREYCEALLKIRTKEQKLAPLRFNEAQEHLYGVIREQARQGKPIRLIVLKGRQEGISTVTEGLMFQDAATRANVKTLIVAHDASATATASTASGYLGYSLVYIKFISGLMCCFGSRQVHNSMRFRVKIFSQLNDSTACAYCRI